MKQSPSWAHQPRHGYLFARPELVPPFLQVLVVAFVQGLQLLGFMLYQEVTLFILEYIPGRTGKTHRGLRHPYHEAPALFTCVSSLIMNPVIQNSMHMNTNAPKGAQNSPKY